MIGLDLKGLKIKSIGANKTDPIDGNPGHPILWRIQTFGLNAQNVQNIFSLDSQRTLSHFRERRRSNAQITHALKKRNKHKK